MAVTAQAETNNRFALQLSDFELIAINSCPKPRNPFDCFKGKRTDTILGGPPFWKQLNGDDRKRDTPLKHRCETVMIHPSTKTECENVRVWTRPPVSSNLCRVAIHIFHSCDGGRAMWAVTGVRNEGVTSPNPWIMSGSLSRRIRDPHFLTFL